MKVKKTTTRLGMKAELANCKDQIRRFKSDIEKERKERLETELKFLECNKKFQKSIDYLQDKVTKLESDINKLTEGKFPQIRQSLSPSSPGISENTLGSSENVVANPEIGPGNEDDMDSQVMSSLLSQNVTSPARATNSSFYEDQANRNNSSPLDDDDDTDDPDPLLDELIDIPTNSVTTAIQAVFKQSAKWYLLHCPSESKRLTCICNPTFKFTNQSSLTEHIRLYTKEYKFYCPLCIDRKLNCQKSFRKLSSFKSHLKLAHDAFLGSDKVIGCRECGNVFSSSKAHKMHLKNSCPRKVSSGQRSQVNENSIHSSDNNFDQQQFMVIHGKDSSVTTLAHFVCYCGASFTSVDRLSTHFENFQKPCKFRCLQCESRFRERHELIEHVKDTHSQQTLQFFVSKRTRTDKEIPSSMMNCFEDSNKSTGERKRHGLESQMNNGNHNRSKKLLSFFSAKRARLAFEKN